MTAELFAKMLGGLCAGAAGEVPVSILREGFELFLSSPLLDSFAAGQSAFVEPGSVEGFMEEIAGTEIVQRLVREQESRGAD